MRTCSPRRAWYVPALILTALLTTSRAEASTITSVHTVLFDSGLNPVPGTITASLDIYTRPYGNVAGGGCCAPQGNPVLFDQFSLGIGSDFYVFIPTAIVDTHAAWEMPIPHGSGIDGGFPWPGLNLISVGFPRPAAVDAISDWCSPSGLLFVNTVFLVAKRGNCAFTDKVTEIQAANGVGAVIVNNIQNAGAFGMALPGFTPSIPLIALSYEKGLEILQMMALTGADSTADLGYFDFAARWDPDPIEPESASAPEPASLALLAAGLAGFKLRSVRRARS